MEKKGKGCPLPFIPKLAAYSAAIASVGQAAAQEPQSWHFAGSIQRALSFSEIASAGHSSSQEPQLTHSLLILYAMLHLSKCSFYTIAYGMGIFKIDFYR
jgi:hypothetical protein